MVNLLLIIKSLFLFCFQIPEMVTTSTPEEEKPSKWDVFREDFMLGASMKDWDKQNNEESNSEYDANSDSDVGQL